MIVEWSASAQRDLIAVADDIVADKSDAALAVVERIGHIVAGLADHPRRGRPGRITGTRELVVPGLPYIIPYRLRDNRVQVLRVLHAARK